MTLYGAATSGIPRTFDFGQAEAHDPILPTMIRRLSILLATLVLAATASGATTRTSGDIGSLDGLGYGITGSLFQDCRFWTVTGYGVTVNFGSDCLPEFSGKIDAFVAGHPERKLGFQHPSAVAARTSLQSKGYSVSTSYSGPTFTVTGGCNVNQTASSSTIVSLDASLPAAAPCPAPPPAADPPPTTTTTSTAPAEGEPEPEPAPSPSTEELERKIAELEAELARQAAALAALAGRVDANQRANVAAWDAWVAAAEAGRPWHEAALAARSAGLNALYEL